MLKLAYEIGTQWSVKTARMGSTVPTGYKFNLDDSWMHSLPPELQARAAAETTSINQWLAENAGLGKGYATHPDFSRRLALLGKLGRQAPVAHESKMASEFTPADPPKAIKPPKMPTFESPSTSSIPAVRPAKKSNGSFSAKLTPIKLGPPKLAFLGNDQFHGGDADKKKPSDFNQVNLRRGAMEEHKEHGLPLRAAKEIASDHLVEKPNYYEKANGKS